MSLRFCAPLLALLCLNACTSVTVPQDGAPSREVDVSTLRDAEPKVERRTLAGNKSPYMVLGKTYRVMDDPTGFKQSGVASWYGTKFHGRLTSNGETYDMFAMTAAHKGIPIPSYVRVSNRENGRSVVVRVNDRGPFHGDRIIDLSFAAAKKLGYSDKGTALVDLEVITPAGQGSHLAAKSPQAQRARQDARLPEIFPANTYLQVGAFGDLAAAEAYMAKISEMLGRPMRIKSAQNLHKVQLGPIADRQSLQGLRRTLAKHKVAAAHVVYD